MLPDQYSPKNVLPGVAIVVVVYVYSNLSTTTKTAKKKKEEWPRSGHFSRLRLRTVWEIAQVLEGERERGERGR